MKTYFWVGVGEFFNFDFTQFLTFPILNLIHFHIAKIHLQFIENLS